MSEPMETPNTKALDKAVKEFLKDAAEKGCDELAIERRRKAIMVAIQWEKVRNNILGGGDDFNPEDL